MNAFEFITDREQRLAAINQELAQRGLRLVKKLGDWANENGEWEIRRILEIHDHSKKFFTDIKFEVHLPGSGDIGAFTVRYQANGEVSDGAVIVTVINGRYAIVKQWRLPLGRWMEEVPRGFGDKIDAAKLQGNLGTLKLADLPLKTVTRELGEEALENSIFSITHLGNIASDTGTSAIIPSYYLVIINVDEEQLQARLRQTSAEGIKLYLWDAPTVRKNIGVTIVDAHSIVALTLAAKHFASMMPLTIA